MDARETSETLEWFGMVAECGDSIKARREAAEILSSEPCTTDLERLSELFNNADGGCFGVESITLADEVSRFYFINTGDTYNTTVGYIEEYFSNWPKIHPYTLTTWGDIYEQSERERTESAGEIRCSQCGEWSSEYNSEYRCTSC